MPGKKNNKNALKHGFYSKNFTADHKKRLEGQEALDILSEIELIRVCIDKLQDELDFDAVAVKDSQGNTTRDDHYLKQLNTLSQMTQAISTLARTHYLIRGRSGDVHDSIMKALEELRIEMGL